MIRKLLNGLNKTLLTLGKTGKKNDSFELSRIAVRSTEKFYMQGLEDDERN